MDIFQITAALILVFFYGTYYAKQLVQRHQGIRTNQIKNQDIGRKRAIGLLMSLASVLVPVAELGSIGFSLSGLPEGVRLLGIFLAAAGDILFLTAVVTMGNSWRAGVSREEHTALVTNGIYSISRNPAFLAFDLVYIGILLMFFNPWLLILTLFAISMFHLQIIWVEEPFLPEAFGAAYADYRKKVCRYLGRKNMKNT